MSELPLIVCEHCEAVYRRPALSPGEIADCRRCGGPLGGRTLLSLEGALACTLAGLIAFLIATTEPLLSLTNGGFHSKVTLWGAILATWDDGFPPLALACALGVFFFPLLKLSLYAHVLAPLLLGQRARRFAFAMHALRLMRPWSMVEVFTLGILVSAVKLTRLAEVTAGPAVWGFAGLTIMLTLLSTMSFHAIWDRAEHL